MPATGNLPVPGAMPDEVIAEFGRIALTHANDPLPHYAACLRRITHADALLIGEITGARDDVLSVVAVSAAEPALAGETALHLVHAPSADIMRGHEVVLATGARKRYPYDAYLQQRAIDGYIGVPLLNRQGTPIGALVAMHRSPQPLAPMTRDVLAQAAPLLGAHLEARVSAAQLERLHAIDSFEPSERFARLAQEACVALRARAAMVCSWQDSRPTQVTILAAVDQGVHLDSLVGTSLPFEEGPCRTLRDNADVQSVVLDDVGEQYPALSASLGWYPISYAGTNLGYGNESVYGHIAVLHDGPLSQTVLEERFWDLLVSRTRLELLRSKREQERATFQRASVMRQKDDSLARMAGHIAHDFNNLLMGVLGNADLSLIADDEAKRNKYLQGIRTASLKASDLVSQLLNYAGKTVTDQKATDIVALLRRCRGLFQMTVPDSITVTYDLADDSLRAHVDPSQLEHVIINLLMNAADACGENGQIVVQCSVEHLEKVDLPPLLGRLDTPGEYVCLKVTDNGCGMDMATLSRVFDPFFSTKDRGRGLGLSTVRGFVLSHVAALDVQTAPGRGTSLHLYFPRTVAHETQDAETPGDETAAPLSLHQPVLVVDDDHLVREVVGEYLAKHRIEVLTCENGRTAIELLQERTVAAVVTDVAMPEVDGWGLLTAIRQRNARLPVLLMSGYTDNWGSGTTADPYTTFLRKPFAEHTLMATLGSLL